MTAVDTSNGAGSASVITPAHRPLMRIAPPVRGANRPSQFNGSGGFAIGVAEFDHVGGRSVPSGQNSGFVENPTVTDFSHSG